MVAADQQKTSVYQLWISLACFGSRITCPITRRIQIESARETTTFIEFRWNWGRLPLRIYFTGHYCNFTGINFGSTVLYIHLCFIVTVRIYVNAYFNNGKYTLLIRGSDKFIWILLKWNISYLAQLSKLFQSSWECSK